MNLRIPFVATSVASLVTLSGTSASAQSISAGPQPYPERIVGGQDLGVSTRPPQLNPYGVNGADCTSDMTLRFSVVLAGFDGSSSVVVWASTTGDCTSLTGRGGAGAVAATCWLLGASLADVMASSPTSYTFDIRVQDLVGPQNAPPYPVRYAPQDASACTQQPTSAGVPINLYFMAFDASNELVGTPYQVPLSTDLVGPPAPTGLALGTQGPDAFATWTANVDADTAGYALFDSLVPSPDAGGPGACSPTMDLAAASGGDAGSIPGVSTWGATSTRLDLGPVPDPTQVGAVLYAVDGSGNVSTPSTQVCDPVTAEAAGAGDASGGSGSSGCACSTFIAAGSDAPVSACFVALGIALARRRRRTGEGQRTQRMRVTR